MSQCFWQWNNIWKCIYSYLFNTCNWTQYKTKIVHHFREIRMWRIIIIIQTIDLGIFKPEYIQIDETSMKEMVREEKKEKKKIVKKCYFYSKVYRNQHAERDDSYWIEVKRKTCILSSSSSSFLFVRSFCISFYKMSGNERQFVM